MPPKIQQPNRNAAAAKGYIAEQFKAKMGDCAGKVNYSNEYPCVLVRFNYRLDHKSGLDDKPEDISSEVSEKIGQLKMAAPDGKMRLTDVADTQALFRLIQSIPSPKAEPFKLWLAKVGYERIEKNEDPEKTIDRAMATYFAKGYSKDWINQRLKSIDVQKELTYEWERRGIKQGQECAILTDEITKAWSGMNTKGYKQFKNLKKENLRDNMTNLGLVLNMLAEATTAEISKEKQPQTFAHSKIIAKQGGAVSGNA